MILTAAHIYIYIYAEFFKSYIYIFVYVYIFFEKNIKIYKQYMYNIYIYCVCAFWHSENQDQFFGHFGFVNDWEHRVVVAIGDILQGHRDIPMILPCCIDGSFVIIYSFTYSKT